MPRAFSTAIEVLRRRLSSAEGFFWFVEIERAASAGGGVYRLVDSDRPITGDGKMWAPAPLQFQMPEESASEAIGEMTVTIPNVSRIAIGELEARALQGRPIRVMIEHDRDLAAFSGAMRWSLVIVKATATAAYVTLSCSHPLGLDRMPSRIFDASVAPVFAVGGGGGGGGGAGGRDG